MLNRRSNDVNPLNSIVSILFLVMIFVGLFFVAKAIFTLLAWVAPILLVLAAIFDYNTILDYGKWLWNLLRTNVLVGIGAVLLTIFGFPVIAGFLFVKAWVRRKVVQMEKGMEQQQEGEYVEFEEVESTTYEPIELPPIQTKAEPEPRPKPEQRTKKNDYEDLFD